MNRGKKKILTTLTYFFMALLILSTLSISYSIFLYKGIETFYRTIITFIILYITGILSYSFFTSMKKEKFKRFVATTAISIIFISVFTVGTYYVYTLYNKLNNFNKDRVVYTSMLITFNNDYKNIKDIKNAKIGILDDTANYESNILALEVIDKYKLEGDNELIKHSSTLELMTALYNEEVDLIFIAGNYVELFSSLEEYKDIEKKAIEVFEYSKSYNKQLIEEEHTDTSKLLTEPFTILLIGVDSTKVGLDKNAAFNGDTLMLISFNPKTLQATMFSIPRDTYVPITCSGNTLKKINTSAYGGTKCVVDTVTKFTGINIDYYVKINFKGVVDLVNSIGGITVDIPIDFCESNSNRQQGIYEICLKKGLQTIDGEEALAFARNRYAFGSDFVRGQNQQTVVEGILNQAKTIKSIAKVYEVLDTVSKNIDTNLTTTQMLSFYDVLKSLVFSKNNNVLNIQKTFLRGYDMYVYEPAAGGSRYAFFNFKGSLNDITNAMKVTLGIQKGELTKEFSFSINELYERKIIGDNYYSESRQTTVPNFLAYNIGWAKNWANSHNLNFTVIDYNTNQTITNYENYTIVSQKEPFQTLTSRISSITIYATSIIIPETPEEPEEDTSTEDEIPEVIEPVIEQESETQD